MENTKGAVGKRWQGVMLAVAMMMFCLFVPKGWADDTRMITVKRGDTVASLCREVYHTYSREVAALLQEANPELTDLNRIRVGQTLRFPSLSMGKPTAPTAVATEHAAPVPTEPTPPATTRSDAERPAPPTASGDQMAQVFFRETVPPNSLLPAGTTLAPGFEPAGATPIGAVEQAQGQAWIIHQGSNLAYTAARDQPLFTGDTLVTDTRAELRCRLDDQSTFAMAGHSKLVLDKTVYDPDKDRRESVLQLLFGRARFIVNHLRGSYANDYQVRTPTAICGVRGSDFVVAVQPTDATTTQSGNMPPKKESWPTSVIIHLSEWFSVRSAHAFGPASLITTVLSGPGTTVGFGGLIGPSQLVTAGFVSSAVTGGAATGPLGVSAGVMGGALNSVGPMSGVMAMPQGLE